MSRKLINMGKRHLEKNYIIYFILALFSIIGIIVGSIFILKVNESENFKLISYLNYTFKYLENNNYTSTDISKSSLFFNMKILLFVWILGFIGFGSLIIPLIICFKGISIGFTVGFFVKKFSIKGFLLSMLGLLPNYIILIPVFFIMGTISILKSLSYTYMRKNKLQIISFGDYSIFLLVFLFIILFTTFLEGLFVSNLFRLMKI